MVDFDPTKPLASDFISDYPAVERSERLKVEDWTKLDHYEADGKHRVIHLKEESSDPSVIANEITLYGKLASGKCNLFLRDEDDNVIQLTLAGSLRGPLSNAVLTGVVGVSSDIQMSNAIALTGRDQGNTNWRDLIQISATDSVEVGNVYENLTLNIGTFANLRAWDGSNLRKVVLKVEDEGVGNGFDADKLDGNHIADVWAGAVSYASGRYFTGDVSPYALNGAHALSHGLGAIPRLHYVTLVCTSTDVGYAVGDEIYPGSSDVNDAMTPWASSTQVGCSAGSADPNVQNKTGGGNTGITEANWDVRHRAWL